MWGGGISGSLVVRELIASGMHPLFAVDSNRRKWGTVLEGGVSVVSPDELKEFSGTLYIACAGGTALKNRLREFRDLDTNYELNWLVNARRFVPYWRAHPKKLLNFRSRLRGQDSKRLLDLICQESPPTNNEIKSLSVLSDYFNHPRIKKPQPGHVIICGASVGEEVDSVMRCLEGSAFALLVEPNPVSARQLRNSPAFTENFSKFRLLEKALGRKEESAFLRVNGVSSRVNLSGEENPGLGFSAELVDVTTLDLIWSHNQPVQIITLDVEGDELAVLEGAVGTIEKWSPILAVSVYHQEQDLFEITDFLDSMAVDWEYELSLLDFGVNDLTLFAFPRVPQEFLQ